MIGRLEVLFRPDGGEGSAKSKGGVARRADGSELGPADEVQDAAAEETYPAQRTCCHDRPAAGGPFRTSRWREEASWDSVLCPDVLPYRRMTAGVRERCETIEAHYGPVAQRIEQQPSKQKEAL
jgi:hypothetical protein